VERELFPGDDTRTRTGRLESLERDDPEIPNEVDLVSFAGEATSMYGQIAAMCQGGALYGYAYALAFWHAADLDRTRLREVIAQSINPGDSNLALMFKTHPSFDKRLALLADEMTPALDAYERQPALDARFAGVLGAKQ
jgi:hypothetical protein